MSDFTTADTMVRKKKPRAEDPEHSCVQDDPDSRCYLEVLCDKAKVAIMSASDDRWEESVASMTAALHDVAGVCGLSGRDWAKARAEEILMTVRVCQSVSDIETANILPELERVRRHVGQPNTNTRGAMY